MEQYLKLFRTKADYEAASEKPPISHIVYDVELIEKVDPCNVYEYVEIGGLKWATKNVGACNITDAGLYFQWGDVQGYTVDQCGRGEGQKYFGWPDYKFNSNPSVTYNPPLTKYSWSDRLTALQPEDDAANVICGGNWRMPTNAEYAALSAATTSGWTDNYEGSGVKGLVLTDKTDSNKKLFFPAVSYCVQGAGGMGNYGFYWTKNLSTTDAPYYSYCMNFYQSIIFWNLNADRYYGCTIRGVLDE